MNNTSVELLEFMKKCFGGAIYQDKTPRNKTNWQWVISSREDVMSFITSILPLLKETEKIRRGGLLMKFCQAAKEQKLTLLNEFRTQNEDFSAICNGTR
jgi:hypothetical protein